MSEQDVTGQTEPEAVGAEVRATMDVEQIGTLEGAAAGDFAGQPIYWEKNALGADAVLRGVGEALRLMFQSLASLADELLRLLFPVSLANAGRLDLPRPARHALRARDVCPTDPGICGD